MKTEFKKEFCAHLMNHFSSYGRIVSGAPLNLEHHVVACIFDEVLCVFVAQTTGVALPNLGDNVSGFKFAFRRGASQRLKFKSLLISASSSSTQILTL